MSPEFLRQRRNLIGINIIIILFKVAEVSTDKLTILGTTFEIGKPEVIPYFVWALWLYFLIRYYQYINSEKDFDYKSKLINIIRTAIKKHIEAKETRVKLNELPLNHKINNNGLFLWEYGDEEHDKIGQSISTNVQEFSKFRVYWYVLKATISVSVKTNQFTEYILPFLLAILAPIISVFT